MEIINRKIKDLIPYENNPKKHPESQLDLIIKSFEMAGFINPVVIDSDDVIVCGHGRVLAAKKKGLKEVPCVQLDVDKVTADQIRLLENKTLESDYDLAKLSQELARFSDDLSMTGFDQQEYDDLIRKLEGNTQWGNGFDSFENNDDDFANVGMSDGKRKDFDEEHQDDIPEEVEVETRVKPGDIWRLGDHLVLCGDCTVERNVRELLGDKKVDMVFTDPPYGMALDADFSSMKSKISEGSVGNKYENIIGDHSDFNPVFITKIFEIFSSCKEIFIWGADYFSELLPDKNKGSWVVWDKRTEESSDKMYGSCFELCWSKNKHKRLICRIKWSGFFGLQSQDTSRRVHPTQKPIELPVFFFNQWGKESVTVADPFLGSGTTLIACEKTNRVCIGTELSPKYCDVIVTRWEKLTGRTAVLERNINQ